MNTFQKNIRKIWADPVFSKVIAAGIIFILGSIGTIIWVLIKSISKKESIMSSFLNVINFMLNASEINNLLILAILSLFLWMFFPFIINFAINIKIKLKNIKKKIKVNLNSDKSKDPQKITVESTVFLWERLTDAFPGQRGICWYNDPKVIVDRLQIALRDPLRFEMEPTAYGVMVDPIWWFRDGASPNSTNYI
jgi:hypothetical protein